MNVKTAMDKYGVPSLALLAPFCDAVFSTALTLRQMAKTLGIDDLKLLEAIQDEVIRLRQAEQKQNDLVNQKVKEFWADVSNPPGKVAEVEREVRQALIEDHVWPNCHVCGEPVKDQVDGNRTEGCGHVLHPVCRNYEYCYCPYACDQRIESPSDIERKQKIEELNKDYKLPMKPMPMPMLQAKTFEDMTEEQRHAFYTSCPEPLKTMLGTNTMWPGSLGSESQPWYVWTREKGYIDG